METQQLKYFVAVAQHRSFSKASSACFVSQPALSTQIKTLEEGLGCELFHRTKRSVTLSKEGEKLLPLAKKILADMGSFQSQANVLSNPFASTLNIGISPMIAQSNVFEKLLKLKSRYPKLQFEFLENTTFSLLEDLDQKKLDVVIVPNHSLIYSGKYLVEELDKDMLVYCFPKKIRDFQTLPFIGVHRGCGLMAVIENAANKLDFDPKSNFQAHHVDMIVKWILLGLGWSLLPRRSLSKANSKLLGVKIPERKTHILYCGVMLRGKRGSKILGEINQSLQSPIDL